MVDTSEARIYDEIEIEDMTYDPVTQLYTYPCPCGDRFEINIEDLRDGEEIAVCPSCSLMIRVIYEVEELPAAHKKVANLGNSKSSSENNYYSTKVTARQIAESRAQHSSRLPACHDPTQDLNCTQPGRHSNHGYMCLIRGPIFSPPSLWSTWSIGSAKMFTVRVPSPVLWRKQKEP